MVDTEQARVSSRPPNVSCCKRMRAHSSHRTDFKREEEQESLDGVEAAIDEVAEEAAAENTRQSSDEQQSTRLQWFSRVRVERCRASQLLECC